MIEQVVTPATHDLGAFKVRRALPARERTTSATISRARSWRKFGPSSPHAKTKLAIKH